MLGASPSLSAKPIGLTRDDVSREELNFTRVYRENVSRVYGFLAYRMNDQDAAEDLTQLTFERALRAWGRFDPRRASPATWLLSIARNALIDDRRRDRVAAEHQLAAAPLEPVPGPEQRLSGSPELLVALARLGQREREVLALRFGGDLTAREIGGLLGLSLANVQQIQSRALRALRAQLEGADSEEQTEEDEDRAEQEAGTDPAV